MKLEASDRYAATGTLEHRLDAPTMCVGLSRRLHRQAIHIQQHRFGAKLALVRMSTVTVSGAILRMYMVDAAHWITL